MYSRDINLYSVSPNLVNQNFSSTSLGDSYSKISILDKPIGNGDYTLNWILNYGICRIFI